MNIGQIYRRAFEIVKNNRWLWIFGVILSSFAGGTSLNFSNILKLSDLSNNDTHKFIDQVDYNPAISYFKDLLISIPPSAYISLAIIIILALIIGFIISLVVSAWARGSAIGAINDAYEGKNVSLRSGSEHGLRSLKKILWLTIVPWFLYSLTLIIVGGLLILLIILFPNTPIMYMMVFFLIILILIAALVGLAISAIQIWAERLVVIEKKEGREAFNQGWLLVKNYFSKMILLGTANCFLGCCFGFSLIGTIFGLVIASAVLICINKKFGVFLLILFGFFILLLVLLMTLLNGIYKIFNYTTWNILYRQIREEKK